MDPYKFLRITRNPDGSLTRPMLVPLSPPSETASAGEAGPLPAVRSKDAPLNPSHGTWLRIFVPGGGPGEEPRRPRLPVLLYFHGGGYILYSAASAPFHESCCRLSRELPAIVVSVEYRLAPEHRLPAAYDDAIDAVRWLHRQAAAAMAPEEGDPWLRDHADFSRCFLAGSSSGGNIAYHAARRLLDDAEDLRPLGISGLILNQPFFGGAERTPSEAASAGDRIVPLPVNDLMWELALPEGADRDHLFCNPMVHHRRRRGEQPGPGQPLLPRCLVRGYLGDPLIDRQRQLAALLEEQAAGTVTLLDREGFHGVELFDRSKADLYVADVKQFVCSSPPHPSPPELSTPHAAAADPAGLAAKY